MQATLVVLKSFESNRLYTSCVLKLRLHQETTVYTGGHWRSLTRDNSHRFSVFGQDQFWNGSCTSPRVAVSELRGVIYAFLRSMACSRLRGWSGGMCGDN